MMYNNYQEFLNALKSKILLGHVKNVANASFNLKEEGYVLLNFSVKMPERGPMDQPLIRMKVHPCFAWGIYQLMSNLNAQQL